MSRAWDVGLASFPFVVVIGATVGWLSYDALRERQRTRAAMKMARRYRKALHSLENSDGSGVVTVSELLDRTARQGAGARLNWSEADTDSDGLALPHDPTNWPTVVLPRVEDGEM